MANVKIRMARKQNALSQAELAAKVAVTQGTISNWEVGKQEPEPGILKKLQEVLGADLFTAGKTGPADATSVLAEWLSKTRQQAAMTAAQLAENPVSACQPSTTSKPVGRKIQDDVLSNV